VTGTLRMTGAGAAGEKYLAILHSSKGRIASGTQVNPGTVSFGVSYTGRMTTGDSIYMNEFQNSGATYAMDSSGGHCRMSIVRLR